MELSLALVVILVSGILCQWLAWRLKIPAIVLLATAGLILGPISGWVKPAVDFGPSLNAVIQLFVAVILFEGGLNLQLHELREAGRVVRRLTSVGVVVAWVLGSVAAHFVGGLGWPVALLLGAILVVTGPTVIMPLLKHANLNRRTASYLKWEGIINDPLGVMLAVIVYQYFLYSGEATGLGHALYTLAEAIVIAVLVGGGGGYLLGFAFRRSWVPEYLKAPMIIAVALGVYALSHLVLHESGLLAVTVMGVVMGNMGLRSIEEMRRFKEYITIILVSFLFVILTASLEPRVLTEINWQLIAMLLAFLFVVRPLTVWISTARINMPWQERLLVGWIAPRGVVAAASAGAFAPAMIEAGYEGAELLVPAVFLVIFATVILHGFSLGPLASRLRLRAEGSGRVLIVGASPWSVELAKVLKELKVDVMLADTDWARLRPARQQGVPTWYGEILSERAEEALELDGVKVMLAATGNVAYNSMVCNHFASEIGRNRVYQLTDSENSEENERRRVSHVRRGVSVFSRKVTFGTLWNNLIRDWRFQKTRVTEEYSGDDIIMQLPDDAIMVAVVDKEGRLNWVAKENPSLKVGDTLLSFVPPAQS
ncbi:NhaP-type Na+/H+ or K+/H+ antiporter [Litorivivens lipolytica]|uniref:NhaP-type Na+/H+ or K+/H+ antiporter n=1 Tax=Litorivivens lipolytica TaxID=1524264 RepID=A0A7W4W4L9_9GAMM|nr:cation:proton antiporter [Litorivivens lipolytica]MBB3047363.1 NhaP-type Na+/H+ or K+/H+ antiporter [Litorivivens lipolytica]